MPFVDAGGFELHYEVEGDAAKPVVVLSNSLGADLSMWDGQMEALLGSFRVLRYDTRGHGESSMPNEPCSLASLGHDIVALLNALAIERAHVCGVSLGGLTAMWVGLYAPKRVRSLVLSNTAAKIGTDEVWQERIARVEAEGLKSIAEGVIARWFTSGFKERGKEYGAWRAMLLGCSAAGYLAASAALRDSDLRGEIQRLAVPTLILSGVSDVVTPPSDGQFLGGAIRGSLFRQVPGAHLSNIEEPGVYNTVLLEFLQQPTHLEVTP